MCESPIEGMAAGCGRSQNEGMRSDLHRLQLANRIHLQLLRERRPGIDVQRMLERPLYAREVLRACEGPSPAGDALPLLAAQWRILEDMPLTRWPQGLPLDIDLGHLAS
jgi:hypothetical protein